MKDGSGALIAGASIQLTDKSTQHVYQGISNVSGSYIFPLLAPARYLIAVSAPGFAAQSREAELLVSQPATINFTLGVAGNAVTVDVTASAQTLNTTDATIGNSQNNALIQALPSEERNVPDLLSLQPGVLYIPTTAANNANPTGDSRSGAVNGIRSDQGNVTMDGIDDNDQVFGYAFTGVLRETQDSVEEFRVTTANANSSDGRSAGAQVSLVTKSGSNRLHGAAYEYNRPTFTVANNWLNKQTQLTSGEQNRPPKLIRNIFGVSLGGPILKDKLFFFANYEGLRRAENQEVVETVPTQAFQQGYLTYTDTNGNTVQLAPSDVAGLDAGCQVCNTPAYSPAPGPNPYVLKYFQSMPAANGTAAGDLLNTGSYGFSAPNPVSQNTSIARIDWSPNAQHKLFFRGNLQKDVNDGAEQFPGQGASSILEDNTKGFALGDTWVLSETMVNDLRYGFVRQGYSRRGIGSGDYIDFRNISSPTAETRTTINSTPVNNLVDNLNWSKGRHSIQIGGNWRMIGQNSATDSSSYNSGTTNPSWLAGTPAGFENVSTGFQQSYLYALDNMLGTVAEVEDVYNYKITSATSATALADGVAIDRAFKANEFEWYVQDSFRFRPNLTITLGVRHSILQTPHETNGQQVMPTIDTHNWYTQREQQAQQGNIYEPLLTFAPSGPYYNKPGYWPKAKDNFAPRLAVAYSPDGKTSIRAGAGIYYDHFGQSLVSIYNQNGSFGMSSTVFNPANTYSSDTAPRFTARNVLPYTVGSGSATQSYPYQPSSDLASGFAVGWGLDSRMKTPYAEAFNLSVERELGKGLTLEVAWVGTMGRHLLQSLDLAEPVNYKDPSGGGSYFAAAAQLSKDVDANGGNYGTAYPVAAIPYFENVFSFMQGLEYEGESATQAIYDLEWGPYRQVTGATQALADLDFYGPQLGTYPAPSNWQPHFYQSQFSSLYALSTVGMSNYNSGQITLRHPMSHGYQLDVSYTFSHSLDLGSDTERSTWNSTSTSLSSIINTWNPAGNYASSDFDTRHLLTVDAVYDLPVGRGKMLLGDANRWTEAAVGGWQLSGLSRVTSGLPFSLIDPCWTTDYQISSFAVTTGNVRVRKHYDASGNAQYFDNPTAINNGAAYGNPVRVSYPGETGQRNNFRGDGFLDIDSGLSKTWALPHEGSAKFAWEVYNVTNTVRFDPASITNQLTNGSLGIASSFLTTPRRMQFSLRIDF